MIRLESVYFNDFVPNWRKAKMMTDKYLLCLVTHGGFEYTVEQTSMTLTKGDVVVVRPGIVRSGSDGQHPPHQKYSAHFVLDPSAEAMLGSVFAVKGYILFKTGKLEYLRQHFHQLYQAWNDKSPYGEMICCGLVTELFGNVLQELGQANMSSAKLNAAQKLEDYIFKHYKEDITITQLAELVQLSPNYVISIFKEKNKQTPMEFVHQLRISIAQDLLLHTDMNISEVSDHLGFCAPSYFNRVFKKVAGKPPSALLRQRGDFKL
ncbi:MAG: hypothetical protein K0Q59_5235 [Paenibacillus sp.]|nr:hypothetical protein [Paenibacillus sp.]